MKGMIIHCICLIRQYNLLVVLVVSRFLSITCVQVWKKILGTITLKLVSNFAHRDLGKANLISGSFAQFIVFFGGGGRQGEESGPKTNGKT